METAAIDYDLPTSAIAQTPVEPRDAARLLVDRGPGAAPEHRRVRDLPALVGPGDVVVVNTTRVLRARLRLTRPTGGAVEVLLLEPRRPHRVESQLDTEWQALVRPSRRVPPGSVFTLDGTAAVIVGDDLGEGRRHVTLALADEVDVLTVLERHGAVPLPPYITTALDDPERYQTTYAERPGSVAAPTAGLHLTPALLDQIRLAGARVLPVELVVGLGTFRPIAAERVEEHHMHAERYRVPEPTMVACRQADRVVAIGTTSVRALESAAASGELEGSTDLFIHGERRPALVGALMTNFHQPRSSLLALVDAFIGPRWRDLYGEALRTGYRFLSFGDAMFLRGERG
jgi:S-adenosylmethionine:tRNA ribosyltransferase-isomerase